MPATIAARGICTIGANYLASGFYTLIPVVFFFNTFPFLACSGVVNGKIVFVVLTLTAIYFIMNVPSMKLALKASKCK